MAQPAPEGAVETTLLAEGLAEAGDPRAVAHIQALRGVDGTEAEAATARLALRLDRPDLARDALVAAFVHYRADPWASQLAMSHALALADELTLKHPDAVPALFEALGHPFAASALEEPRRLVRLSVGSRPLEGAVRRFSLRAARALARGRLRTGRSATSGRRRRARPRRAWSRAVPPAGGGGPGRHPAPRASGSAPVVRAEGRCLRPPERYS
jgi:hypothetical protein